jgi:hypothetical protein
VLLLLLLLLVLLLVWHLLPLLLQPPWLLLLIPVAEGQLLHTSRRADFPPQVPAQPLACPPQLLPVALHLLLVRAPQLHLYPAVEVCDALQAEPPHAGAAVVWHHGCYCPLSCHGVAAAARAVDWRYCQDTEGWGLSCQYCLDLLLGPVCGPAAGVQL